MLVHIAPIFVSRWEKFLQSRLVIFLSWDTGDPAENIKQRRLQGNLQVVAIINGPATSLLNRMPRITFEFIFD